MNEATNKIDNNLDNGSLNLRKIGYKAGSHWLPNSVITCFKVRGEADISRIKVFFIISVVP